MGKFRFFRRIKVAPGVTLNLSKRGVSASFGPRGAKATIGTSGRRYSVGLPGTGLFWREDVTSRKRGSSAEHGSKPGDMSTSDCDTIAAHLRPGFFEKIFMSDIEKTLREALAHVLQQKYFEAVMLLLDYPHEPDLAFLLGYCYLKRGEVTRAIPPLVTAAASEEVGSMISGIRDMRATWYTAFLTDGNICVCYGIDHQGTLFLLASAYQQAERVEDALEILAELHEEDPENGVAALGLAATIVGWDKADDEALEEVLAATEPALDNENAVETGLLLCRAKALRRLGLFDAARKIISLALRRKKGRPEEVFLALRYERALCYQQEGHIKRMQKEFEKIYAIDTDFKDVKERVHGQG